MNHQLFWIFGTPEEEDGILAVDFYYQAGKHTRLHIPIPAPRFQAAGELPFHLKENNLSKPPAFDLPSNPVEAGKKLFSILGEEAQKTLIQTFANLENHSDERLLYLIFSTPSTESNEWSLTLEDLPWEYLHDGNQFISQRYQLQIVRNHVKHQYPFAVEKHDINDWRILLVSPFVFSNLAVLNQAGLSPLPGAQKEILTLRALENETSGFINISPPSHGKQMQGITTLDELNSCLSASKNKPFHIIHFCGHGVMYEDEPCLCFETDPGGIEYVNVDQLKRALSVAVESNQTESLPDILFLNACSSSSRGKYSAGFAAGLHELNVCVLGYQTQVRDDDKLVEASKEFYRSLCIQQPLQQAYSPSSVIKAVGDSRRQLHNHGGTTPNHSANMQVYLPTQLQFQWTGRGFVERRIQSMYSRFAEWTNPSDFTSHLSLVFFSAFVFGTLFGIENVLFIFPESVLTNYLNYTEIVSELTRIFMIGPLSFLAAAIWIAWITQIEFRLLMSTHAVPKWKWPTFLMQFIPLSILAGVSYSLMFSYSFSHMDLLTAKTKELAPLLDYSTAVFWYGLSGFMGATMTISLALAVWICYRKRETLHTYHVYSVMIAVYIIGGAINCWLINQQSITGIALILDWFVCSLINIFAYALITTKVIKETCWRSAHKTTEKPNVSWRKLVPLVGGAILVLLCYILLEESVRFEKETIHWALAERSENAGNPQSKYVEKVLERALRQRAIDDVPERVRQVADKDWLLSLIYADHLLFLAQNSAVYDPKTTMAESRFYLENSIALNPAVQYTDFFQNIYAMVLLNEAREMEEGDDKTALLRKANQLAESAVKKDEGNFAYLDTLARAQYRWALHDEYNFIYLSNALDNIQQAEWSAFFLRSSRADEVRESIRTLRNKIEETLNTTQTSRLQ